MEKTRQMNKNSYSHYVRLVVATPSNSAACPGPLVTIDWTWNNWVWPWLSTNKGTLVAALLGSCIMEGSRPILSFMSTFNNCLRNICHQVLVSQQTTRIENNTAVGGSRTMIADLSDSPRSHYREWYPSCPPLCVTHVTSCSGIVVTELLLLTKPLWKILVRKVSNYGPGKTWQQTPVTYRTHVIVRLPVTPLFQPVHSSRVSGKFEYHQIS